MREEDFLFSLYPNDLIWIENKKGIKVNLPNKLAKNSSLTASRVQKEGFFYYKGMNIANAQFDVVVHDGTYRQESLGVKTLTKMEKWTIDVLGGEVNQVSREQRQGFNDMKRDPHAIK